MSYIFRMESPDLRFPPGRRKYSVSIVEKEEYTIATFYNITNKMPLLIRKIELKTKHKQKCEKSC